MIHNKPAVNAIDKCLTTCDRDVSKPATEGSFMADTVICGTCMGSGEVVYSEDFCADFRLWSCPTCNGRGQVMGPAPSRVRSPSDIKKARNVAVRAVNMAVAAIEHSLSIFNRKGS